MFEKQAEERAKDYTENKERQVAYECGFLDGIDFGYNKVKESHSPDEHIDKNRVVLGVIKLCNKTRYSLVQWDGECWYQYGNTAEVRLIAWYNIPELPKEIKEND